MVKIKGERLTVAALMTNADHRRSLLRAVHDACMHSFTPELIKAAFRRTCLYPFDGEGLLRLAAENLGESSDFGIFR